MVILVTPSQLQGRLSPNPSVWLALQRVRRRGHPVALEAPLCGPSTSSLVLTV